MKKQILWLVAMTFMCVGVGAAPVTQVTVSHPKTNVSVTRPATNVFVAHPTTAATVSHPQTTATVTHPQTDVAVSHPTTSVQVSHPTTAVSVAHPQTSTTPADKEKTLQPTKQAVDNSATAPAAQKGSMMSSYQPPQAKDLKAAKLGGGEQGLGKTNEQEKDAAAASLTPPKALKWEDTANSNLKSSLTDKVKDKTK